jgi:glycosyltransferase involved in cell wall biosynthesis
MKVLFVAMFFPPAGGGGVQRPLKFASHLAELGFDVHVLAPDDPKWPFRDTSIEIPPALTVHRARNLGPRPRLLALELARTQGHARAGLWAHVLFRGALIPDGSVLWELTAIPTAIRVVRREGIDVVVTSSSPGSVHLAGAAAKRVTGVRWVADLRDMLVSHIDRRHELRGERLVARLVARNADAIVCAYPAIAREMAAFSPRGRLEVIENGCDFADFDGLEYRPAERFRLTHTGSTLGRRDIRPVLDALARADGDILARFVGGMRPDDRAYADSLGLGRRLEVIPFLPRSDALAFQRDTEALLLIHPDTEGRGKDVLPGKVFEYLAAGRPILAVVAPDGETASRLRETGAALVVPPGDPDAIAAGIDELRSRWRAGDLDGAKLSAELSGRLSRRARAERLADLLRSLR